MTFGHEMAGVVVAHGAGRDAHGRRASGSRVETHIVDWTCYQCRTGRAHVCQNMRILGVHVPGAFAEYVVMPETNAWVYEGLSPEIAALQEPLGNAVHAAFVEEVAGQTALVTGCGPIGLMAIGVLKMAGRADGVRHGHQPGAARDGRADGRRRGDGRAATTSSARLRPRPTATASTSCSRCRAPRPRSTRDWPR